MDISVIEELPTKGFLNFKCNQLHDIRKLFNLEKPERIQESIKLLRDWLQKQDYYNKKDFSDSFFERLLILSKGSVERAKSCFDKLCTFRAIWPQLFTEIDVNSFKSEFKTYQSIILPDLTDEYARVNLLKINSNVPLNPDLLTQYFKYSIIMCEYVKRHDYPNGFVIIIDYQNVNLVDLLAIVSASQLHQMVTLYVEGYGMRIQGIHFITTSKLSDAFVSLAKQVLSKKVGSRIHVHVKMETLYDYIPKKILPADYGGDAAPNSEILDNFLKEIGSEEHKEYMKEIQKRVIDLSRKPKDTIDNYIHMAGSFRTLSID